MNKGKLFLSFVFLYTMLFLLVGCYKDIGNYKLKDINEITFSYGSGDTIQINQFDTLRVSPEFDQTINQSAEGLSFKWAVFLETPPVTGYVNEVLSEKRELNVQFGLSPQTYTLLLTVTDNNTGVSFFKKYRLLVNSTLSEGWLIVGEDNAGKTDIHLLHPNGKTIPNILSTANPGQDLPTYIQKVRVLTKFFGTSQDIYVLGKTDAIRVNYVNFTIVNRAADWFIEKQTVLKPQEYRYDMIGLNGFFVNNGRINSNQTDFRFGVPAFGDYYLSEYIFPAQSSDGAIVYDTIHKRFYNYTNKQFVDFSVVDGAPFNMNNVGMGIISAGPAPASQYNYLMRDDAGDFYVLRISYGSPVGKYPVGNAYKIKEARNFAFSSLYFHAYYSVGNEIYLLDIANNTSKLIYSFPSGEEITALRLKQTFSAFVSFSDNNRTLAVGTFNGTEGRAYTFAIDNLGEFEGGTYNLEYENLDKPVFLEYKNKK